jgi:hypothetical protein
MGLLKPVEIAPKRRYDVSDTRKVGAATGELYLLYMPTMLILDLGVTA